MRYTNPVIKGFYPDPSICYADGKFYMVCSSFQYFPGVPLFVSDNLVNWTQIGYVLTRKSQVMLAGVRSSGGVFAPTIRYHRGRFYMVTTNNSTQQNFYVYTDDIHGEWSEPIYVDQDGIDPSLYFEDDKTFFMSNGTADDGRSGVVQCEIHIETGKKCTESICIWQGTGGRFLESPHLYKIGEWYYLMAAEGGTEYGHMITYARAKDVWGDFADYPRNPVLTNRDKAPFIIQGIGHGDLVCDQAGNWHIVSLGFRQIDLWQPYHNLGREVFLTPVSFHEDGWFTAGNDGTCDEGYELAGDFTQNEQLCYTFENTDWDIHWSFLRHPDYSCYELKADCAILHGTEVTLEDVASPTFIALRQRDFIGEMSCMVSLNHGEGGLTVFMCEDEHYDLALRKDEDGVKAILKLNIGGIKHVQNEVLISGEYAKLIVRMDHLDYHFSISSDGKEYALGKGRTKYLSSEVSSGFTGVMLGLYAIGRNTVKFTDFECRY